MARRPPLTLAAAVIQSLKRAVEIERPRKIFRGGGVNMRGGHVHPFEIGAFKTGAAQVGPGDISVSKIGAGKIGVVQSREFEIGAREIRLV